MAKRSRGFGVDIGGTGMKGAPVDLEAGEFAKERVRIPTPDPSTPQAVAAVVAEIVGEFGTDVDGCPIGVTVPAVVKDNVVRTAANIDPSWVGTDADTLFDKVLERDVFVVNDADAAGVAEARYGAARDASGLVLMTTLGTGIGTALLYNGELIPNSELGHIEIDGHDAEDAAAARQREEEDLSWADWAARLQRYYATIEDLLWPDLIVVGGGVSKKAEHFLPLLHLRAPIVAAQLQNTAGVIGAAVVAAERAR
ncbi:MAG: ROK family protein [Streptosporangiales bacterium]|nr:ROK family protein [Streptosporangiales bacterium]